MEDLLEIRDFLAATQEQPRKSEVRSIRKTDGRILLKDSGDEAALGPYKLEFCKEVLLKLLTVQSRLPKEADGFELIADDELLAIRRIWRHERNDWEDAVPRIFEATTRRRWLTLSDVNKGGTDEAALVSEIAEQHDVPELLLKRLIDAERKSLGMKRRARIYDQLNSILNEDWRTDDQVESDIASLSRPKT
jgi:DNA sulfur modification protein DndC